jgi:hypothetical protein
MESLASILERHRLESLLREAEILRDHAACGERIEEARKLFRFVLYEFALGKIDTSARDRIRDVLHFAAERPRVIHEQPVPAYQDEGV